jgi:hypothetical protein
MAFHPTPLLRRRRFSALIRSLAIHGAFHAPRLSDFTTP